MGKIIIKNAIEREDGFLYYIDSEGNLCEAKLKVGGTKKKQKEPVEGTMDERLLKLKKDYSHKN